MEIRKQQCATVVVSISIVAAIVGWLLARFFASSDSNDISNSSPPVERDHEKTTTTSVVKEQPVNKSTSQPSQTTEDYIINLEQAKAVLYLLNSTQDEWVENALVTITRTAAFTQNQQTWRDAGGVSMVSDLVSQRIENFVKEPIASNVHLITSLLNTVTNLATNEQNQKDMKNILPHLMTLSTKSEIDESIQLSALQALTNFSLLNDSHSSLTQIIQQLYELMDTGSHAMQIQILKILVNLSCNDDTVPYLLAAKASEKLPSFIEPRSSADLLLRTVTFLSHIISAVHRLHITAATLPHYYKAASPDTMYAALFGVGSVGRLKSRLFVLTHHDNDEVKRLAASAYIQLPSH